MLGGLSEQPSTSPALLHPKALRALNEGKRVANVTYLHKSLVELQASVVLELVNAALRIAGEDAGVFTVVRISHDRPEIALLHYPDFFAAAFPALRTSWLVDLAAGRATRRDFSNQGNPLILHRKELMLAEDHPERTRFVQFTAALENFGAFDQPSNLIGRRLHWERSLGGLGLRIEGHTVTRDALDAIGRRPQASASDVARHRTAIARGRLSSPMQALARWGFFDGSITVLDYGCGRGDDVHTLRAAGVAASGWDPHFAPGQPLEPADVVNLGFVLNVIEDQGERKETLCRAFSLAKRVLSVAVMQPGAGREGRGQSYADGVLTRQRTFQRYFRQAELRDYVADILGREPVTVGTGLVFVFRNDEEEQAFLERRLRSVPELVDGLRAELRPRERKGQVRPSLYEQHPEILEAFWAATLRLGRLPESGEFDAWNEIMDVFRSARRAFAALPFSDKNTELARAAARRTDDLLVYLALNFFERRRSAQRLPPSVQRDLRCFFGSQKAAAERAHNALFESGSAEHTQAAAVKAAAAELGVLAAKDGDYTFHVSLLQQQPAPLRILLGCAERLEPLPGNVDLLKIHGSGSRVSYFRFDNFAGRALPVLVWRLVVDLRRQRAGEVPVDGPEGRRVLLGKARLMPRDAPGHDRQERFDEALRRRSVLVQEGLGPGMHVLARQLAEAGIIGRSSTAEAQ